ncbi:MAG: peptidoglycan DD-metalloendopeptidase family protein [Hyphomicrobiales bacterium]|nr:peptidoglycan DD-metalloendopeptidase family protein [Hyphomicrobiales bacterium]
MSFVVLSNRLRCLGHAAVIGLVAVIGTGCSSDFSRFDADQFTASISNNQQSNPYPGEVDPVTTSTVSKPIDLRPPMPAGNVNEQMPYSQNQQYPVSNQAPVVQNRPTKTTTNYNTYEAGKATVKVDPVTSGSIKPAKKGVVKTPVNLEKSTFVPATKKTKNGQPQGWTTIGGSAITLGEGETLYNISKRYGVPVTELKKANKISNADQVHAGQRIIVPTYVYSATAPVSAPDNNPLTRASRASKGMIGEIEPNKVYVPTKSPYGHKPGSTAVKLPRNDGSAIKYSVVKGDTLGAIAGKHGIRASELIRVNGLQNTNIREGQILNIPGNQKIQVSGKTDERQQVVGLKPTKSDQIVTGSTPRPYVKPVKTSEIDGKAPARTGIKTFRWPATGRVLSKFGERRHGDRNEGIDISVPVGTSVKAAENGLVIYSDSELQEYGNLLLIRHDGGWVSAYAHNKLLKVKRGEKVRRGQIIAKSGRTGSVERPMIHFELRKDSNPVNPEKYLR